MDYFTKWIKAMPLTNIMSASVQKFFWQNIVCRFGVSRELTVDNGKQFDCITFKDFCASIGTKIKFSSVYHPQSNGAVERANSLIFTAVKRCLFDQKKGKWVNELPKVVWSHNTTESRATGFTPFKLLFGSKAVMPEEIKNKSMRVLKAEDRDDITKVEKDMIKMELDQAVENLDRYQDETRRWRDKLIRERQINVGDLVIKRKHNWENPGKLQETWEGPYIVKRSNRPGSFHFADQQGKDLPHTWNIISLRKYYP